MNRKEQSDKLVRELSEKGGKIVVRPPQKGSDTSSAYIVFDKPETKTE